MICPRCDDQGLLCRARIINLGIEIYVCDECNACWPVSEKVGSKNFKDLTVFLEEQGLTYEESEIEDLGYVESQVMEKNRTFFNIASEDKIIALIDEVWANKSAPLVFDPGVYVIDMQRVIGINGETGMKIIVKPGTAEIKTAYPIKI